MTAQTWNRLHKWIGRMLARIRRTLGCYDCGRPYELGPDLVLADKDWGRIAPTPPCYGVLCPNCMHDRAVTLTAFEGRAPWRSGNIAAFFASGPFSSDDGPLS